MNTRLDPRLNFRDDEAKLRGVERLVNIAVAPS